MSEQRRALQLRAKSLLKRGKYSDARQLYRQLAVDTDADSQVVMGWLCQNGLGANRDEEEAYEWFSKAASLGHAPGAFYCGRLKTAQGHHKEALKWYEKSAKLNYCPAVLWLGISYSRGLGVGQSLDKAGQYYERAIRLGSLIAQRQLAVLLVRGKFGWSRIAEGAWLLTTVAPETLIELARHGYSDRLRA